MSAQLHYGYNPAVGAPGGIYDIAPYQIDTLLNEADNGVMKFGFGVVKGTKPGVNADMPKAESTAADFEGVTINNRTTEFDLDGNVYLRKGKALGVMRWGKCFVRVAEGCTPAYGDDLYLVVSGDEAGKFGNSSVSGTKIAIKGRFLGGVDAITKVAAVHLFNQAQEAGE